MTEIFHIGAGKCFSNFSDLQSYSKISMFLHFWDLDQPASPDTHNASH